MDSNINSICMTTKEYLRYLREIEIDAILIRMQLVGARPDLVAEFNKLKELLNE